MVPSMKETSRRRITVTSSVKLNEISTDQLGNRVGMKQISEMEEKWLMSSIIIYPKRMLQKRGVGIK
jgi:hypothetical protein